MNRTRNDLAGHIRTRRWLHDLLFCPGEQAVMIEVIDVYTKVIQKARAMDPGFIYVPMTYMETLLITYRSLNHFQFDESGFDIFDFDNYPRNAAVLTSFYKLLVELLVDERAVNPDVKENVREIVYTILQSGKGLSVIASDPAISEAVVTNLLTIAQHNPGDVVSLGRSIRSIFGGTEFCIPPVAKSSSSTVVTSSYAILQKVIIKQMQQQNQLNQNQNQQNQIQQNQQQSNTLFDVYYDKLFSSANNAFSDFEITLNRIGGEGLVIGQAVVEKVKTLVQNIDGICTCLRALEVLVKASPSAFYARKLNELRLCEIISYVIGRIFGDTPTARTISYVCTFLNTNGIKMVPPFSPVLLVLSFIGICIEMWRRLGPGAYDVFSQTPNFDPSSFGKAAADIDPKVFMTDFNADPKSVEDYHFFVEFCEYCVKRRKEEEEEKKREAEKNGAEMEVEEVSDDPIKVALSSNELDDESLCEICFANAADTEFVPCGHCSCRVCIERQMTLEPVCFFCKSHIDELKTISNDQ